MKVNTDGVLIGAWAFPNVEGHGKHLLDVGTGTGVIALMMAQRFKELTITAIDIDKDAITEAAENIKSSPWRNRISTKHCDFTLIDTIANKNKYDLIVANPPFFTNGIEASNHSRQCARHQESMRLSDFIAISSHLLTDNGHLAFILPIQFLCEAQYCGTIHNLKISRITRIITKLNKPPKRFMIEFVKGQHSVENCDNNLVLRDTNNNPTAEYTNLVKDFYLKVL